MESLLPQNESQSKPTTASADRQGIPRENALLLGVAEAARQLLAIEDFDAAVNGAIEAIATSAGIDRIFIFKNHVATSSTPEQATCPYEWTVPEVVLSREVPGRFPMVYGEIEGFSEWLDALKAGRCVQHLKEEMSAEGQALQEIDQALSVLTVPIFIKDEYWGNFGFDDCTTARVWGETEIAALETAAATFAAALQRRGSVNTLRSRDELLDSVNAAAQVLVANENLAEAIPTALQILGEGTQQDRVYVFENVIEAETERLLFAMPYEWVAPDIPPAADIQCFPLPADALPEFIARFSREGKPVQFLTRELEGIALELNEKAQALSLVTVPIKVFGQWWGVLGFDDCTTERVWSEAEIAVLETAAACLGSAIERERTAEARMAEVEAHNRMLASRDRILAATAEAANELLTYEALETAINTALALIGEAVDTDRVAIIKSIEAPSKENECNDAEACERDIFGRWQLINEWTSPQTRPVAQSEHPEHVQGTYEGIEDIYVLHCQGKGFSRLIDEFPEPFCSQQKELGVKAMHSVPIMVDGCFWGAVTFDDCQVARRRSIADLAALQTLTDCIGSAVERDRIQQARTAAERTVLVERERAAQARGAELAKINNVLKETLNTLATEPELSGFVGYVLQAIAQQFESPFLEYWRSGENNVAYLELVVIDGEVLIGEQLAEHHGVEGLVVPRYAIDADSLFQRTQYAEYTISPTDTFVGRFYPNIQSWCKKHGVELPGGALNFPVVLGEQSFGAIAIFLPKQQVIPEETIKLGYALANQVALAVQLTQLAEESKQTAVLQEKEVAAQVRATELESHNQTLAKRDRILEATAAAANVMLVNNDFDSAVNEALKIVGEGLVVDRINLGQYWAATSEAIGYHQFLYEWASADVVVQVEHPELSRISDEGIEAGRDVLMRGEVFGGIVDELQEPFRSSQIALGVKSTYGVPVYVAGKYWGLMGFDDCHQQTRRGEAELEALKTLANCIGSAIERDQIQQARKAAERAVLSEREQVAKERVAVAEAHNQTLAKRDRILEATAAAANVMLVNDDFENAVHEALQTVGEGLDVDRILLGKHYEATVPGEKGYHQFLFEWNTVDVVSQVSHPELSIISDEGIEYGFETLKKGEVFGGIVDELFEPFRSSQVALGVQSTYGVPVHVAGQYWGIMALDDCHYQTRRSEAELEALKTLANCIGSAIERDQMRQAREAAERAVLSEREQAAKERVEIAEAHNQTLAKRDRILQATATASNVLLNEEDFDASVTAALQILGESIGFDRIAVGQQMDDPTGETSGFIRFLYEWSDDGISSQLRDHEDLNDFWWDEINLQDWYEANLRGEAFGQLLEDLPEPFQGMIASVEVKSTHNVPIFVEGQFWGVFGIDYCREKRLLSQTDLDALKTAANCVGSAIAQDKMRQAREAAERAVLRERERAAQERAAQLQASNEVLSVRDRWLEATAAAAAQLLSENDLKGAIQPALKTLGESIDVDRIGIMYVFEQDAQQVLGFFDEWIHPSQPVQSEHEELSAIPCHLIGKQHLETLLRGDWYGGDIEHFPEPFCSSQKEIGVQSTYSVPIMIDGQFWGLVGIDHCREKKLLTETEISVFQTIASCFSSAIQRDQIRREREAAERAAIIERERAARADELEAANKVLSVRDRWLQTTAAAANELLSTTDMAVSVNAALTTIGENLECDRVGIMRHLPAPDSLGSFQILYEWDSSGTVNQLTTESLLEMPASDFADWTQRLMAKESVGGLTAEQSEPFRSKLQALGALCVYAVPIFIKAEFWGLMFMDYCQEARQLTPAELAVFETTATCVGSAIYQANIRRDRAAQERAAELAKINAAIGQTLAELAANPKPEHFLGRLLLSLCERTGACKTHLFLYDAATNTLSLHSAVEDGQHYLGVPPGNPDMFNEPFPADITFGWQKTLDSSQPLTYADIGGLEDPDETVWWPQTVDWHRQEGHQQVACARMIAGDVPIGFIGFTFRDRTDHSPEQLEFIQALTNQATLCIQLTRLGEEAKQAAILQEQEKAARDRATELGKANEAIGKSLTTLIETPQLDEFLGQILTRISEPLDACKANLFLYDEQTHTLTQHIVVQDGNIYSGAAPNDPAIFHHPVPADITGAWQAIIHSEKPFTMDDSHPESADLFWPETVAWHKEQGHRAATCACMKVGNKPIGFIGFAFRHLSNLSDEQLEFIQALTNQATLSIHLTRLANEAKQAAILQVQEKAAQERAAQLTRSNQALKSSLDSLAQQPELDSFLQRVVNEATLQTGAASGDLFLVNEAANTCYLHVATDNGGDWRSVDDMALWQQPVSLDAAPGFWDLILKKAPVVVENLQETLQPGPLIWEPSIAWHLNRKHTSFICVPLVLSDRVLGFLGLPFVGNNTITQDDIELAQALANQATLAIQLTQLAEEAKQTAILQEQEKAARDRAAELAKTNTALSQTLDVLTTETELDRFLGKILTQINAQIGADVAHIFLYDAPTHTLRQHIAVQQGEVFSANAPDDPEIFRRPIPADITAAWQLLINSSKPFVIDDNHPQSVEFMWPGTPEWHASQGHLSATCACMRVGDEPLGFIGFAFCNQTILTEEQLEFIQALTNQATLAIQLTRLAEQGKTAALSIAVTEERNRLAREIHDTLAQAFTGVSLQLEAAKESFTDSSEDAIYHINRAGNLARRGLSEARRSVRALRSQALTTDSLPDALRTTLTEMTQDSDTTTRLRVVGTPYALREDIQTNLLRIGQEATTNVLRHAHAEILEITIAFEADRVHLLIIDNGMGTDTSLEDAEGFGLLGMRERVLRFDGHFAFTSKPGKGTVIDITLPTC